MNNQQQTKKHSVNKKFSSESKKIVYLSHLHYINDMIVSLSEIVDYVKNREIHQKMLDLIILISEEIEVIENSDED